ncbi:unnamed protein product, partial [Ectocarpus sp. 13 AM-2016]
HSARPDLHQGLPSRPQRAEGDTGVDGPGRGGRLPHRHQRSARRQVQRPPRGHGEHPRGGFSAVPPVRAVPSPAPAALLSFLLPVVGVLVLPLSLGAPSGGRGVKRSAVLPVYRLPQQRRRWRRRWRRQYRPCYRFRREHWRQQRQWLGRPRRVGKGRGRRRRRRSWKRREKRRGGSRSRCRSQQRASARARGKGCGHPEAKFAAAAGGGPHRASGCGQAAGA